MKRKLYLKIGENGEWIFYYYMSEEEWCKRTLLALLQRVYSDKMTEPIIQKNLINHFKLTKSFDFNKDYLENMWIYKN